MGDPSESLLHGEAVASDGKTSDPLESPLHGEAVALDGKILLPNHGRSTTRTLRERTSMLQSTLNWPSITRKSMAKMMRTSDPSESPLHGEAVASDGKISDPSESTLHGEAVASDGEN